MEIDVLTIHGIVEKRIVSDLNNYKKITLTDECDRRFVCYLELENKPKMILSPIKSVITDMVDRDIDEIDPFWDYFLDEENFKKVLFLASNFDKKELIKLLPPQTIDFNKNSEGLTIHQKREMALRCCLNLSSEYLALDENNEISFYSLKILYMGILEYAGYIELSSGIYFNEPLTFSEHLMVGMEL